MDDPVQIGADNPVLAVPLRYAYRRDLCVERVQRVSAASYAQPGPRNVVERDRPVPVDIPLNEQGRCLTPAGSGPASLRQGLGQTAVGAVRVPPPRDRPVTEQPALSRVCARLQHLERAYRDPFVHALAADGSPVHQRLLASGVRTTAVIAVFGREPAVG